MLNIPSIPADSRSEETTTALQVVMESTCVQRRKTKGLRSNVVRDWLRHRKLEFFRVPFRAMVPRLGLTKAVLQLLSLPLPQLLLTVPDMMVGSRLDGLSPKKACWTYPSLCSLLSSHGSLSLLPLLPFLP